VPTLPLLVLVVLGCLLLTAGSLYLGSRWAKFPRRGFGRAIVATVLIGFIGSTIVGLSRSFHLEEQLGAAFGYIHFAVGLGTTWVIIRLIYGGTFRRVSTAWLVYFAGAVATTAGVLFVVKPLLIEAFTLSANSMSPTMRGYHFIGRCPACGGTAVISGSDFVGRNAGPEKPLGPGVCERCLRFEEEIEATGPQLFGPDRILCNKTLTPKRWDAVVFRYPLEPDLVYVKRLVGMPGEEIDIRNGGVWITGVRQEPPPHLGPLQFAPMVKAPAVFPQQPELPMRLGSDEYFVLGDNTNSATDSRLWGTVPRSNLLGVADVIYWPLPRWRVFP
jgi:signal peptidase I